MIPPETINQRYTLNPNRYSPNYLADFDGSDLVLRQVKRLQTRERLQPAYLSDAVMKAAIHESCQATSIDAGSAV